MEQLFSSSLFYFPSKPLAFMVKIIISSYKFNTFFQLISNFMGNQYIRPFYFTPFFPSLLCPLMQKEINSFYTFNSLFQLLISNFMEQLFSSSLLYFASEPLSLMAKIIISSYTFKTFFQLLISNFMENQYIRPFYFTPVFASLLFPLMLKKNH